MAEREPEEARKRRQHWAGRNRPGLTARLPLGLEHKRTVRIPRWALELGVRVCTGAGHRQNTFMDGSNTAPERKLVEGIPCFQLDPIEDPRWARFTGKHPQASIFHSVAWLQALRDTYGYQPVVFSTSPPGEELKNGLVFCRINSWLTGRRLVSLPFSDHCEPLFDSIEDAKAVIQNLRSVLAHEKWKYLQIRPVNFIPGLGDGVASWQPTQEYFLHLLDLKPDLDHIFKTLDKDSVQRRIQRAERGGLVENCGNSEDLLNDFYRLFLLTRRRQRVPPTPLAWFRNLVRDLGEALEIRVAYKAELPIAAILTLQFRDVLYYKYGCSNAKFNNYGATPWLFWKAIERAKSKGLVEFDLGRTDRDDQGLLAFKDHWVPSPKRLLYWQYPCASAQKLSSSWQGKLGKSGFSLLPGRVQVYIGRWLYPHAG
jgi:GNAT acetyltransferase-like protein